MGRRGVVVRDRVRLGLGLGWYPNPNPNQSPPWDEGRSVAAVPRQVQETGAGMATGAGAHGFGAGEATACCCDPGLTGRRWLGCGGGWAAAVAGLRR
jgi:hypothetical protein